MPPPAIRSATRSEAPRAMRSPTSEKILQQMEESFHSEDEDEDIPATMTPQKVPVSESVATLRPQQTKMMFLKRSRNGEETDPDESVRRSKRVAHASGGITSSRPSGGARSGGQAVSTAQKEDGGNEEPPDEKFLARLNEMVTPKQAIPSNPPQMTPIVVEIAGHPTEDDAAYEPEDRGRNNGVNDDEEPRHQKSADVEAASEELPDEDLSEAPPGHALRSVKVADETYDPNRQEDDESSDEDVVDAEPPDEYSVPNSPEPEERSLKASSTGRPKDEGHGNGDTRRQVKMGHSDHADGSSDMEFGLLSDFKTELASIEDDKEPAELLRWQVAQDLDKLKLSGRTDEVNGLLMDVVTPGDPTQVIRLPVIEFYQIWILMKEPGWVAVENKWEVRIFKRNLDPEKLTCYMICQLNRLRQIFAIAPKGDKSSEIEDQNAFWDKYWPLVRYRAARIESCIRTIAAKQSSLSKPRSRKDRSKAAEEREKIRDELTRDLSKLLIPMAIRMMARAWKLRRGTKSPEKFTRRVVHLLEQGHDWIRRLYEILKQVLVQPSRKGEEALSGRESRDVKKERTQFRNRRALAALLDGVRNVLAAAPGAFRDLELKAQKKAGEEEEMRKENQARRARTDDEQRAAREELERQNHENAALQARGEAIRQLEEEADMREVQDHQLDVIRSWTEEYNRLTQPWSSKNAPEISSQPGSRQARDQPPPRQGQWLDEDDVGESIRDGEEDYRVSSAAEHQTRWTQEEERVLVLALEESYPDLPAEGLYQIALRFGRSQEIEATEDKVRELYDRIDERRRRADRERTMSQWTGHSSAL